MKTLREFWNNFDGVVNFFNKNGEEIDDMNYPLETEILEEKETSTGYWQVVLNVLFRSCQRSIYSYSVIEEYVREYDG